MGCGSILGVKLRLAVYLRRRHVRSNLLFHLLLFHFFFFHLSSSRTRGAGSSACAGGNAVSMAACPLLTACSPEAASCSGFVAEGSVCSAGRSRCRESVSPGNAAHSVPDNRMLHQCGRPDCDLRRARLRLVPFGLFLSLCLCWLLAILLQRLTGQRNRCRGLLLASALAAPATIVPDRLR